MSGDRDQRAEQIRASSREHPLVKLAVSSLVPAGEGFGPRPGLAATLADKLRALGPTDELVAAALGLVELAYVLRKQASPAAADALLQALAETQQQVDDALSTLPPDDATLAGLRAARFGAFLGGPASPTVERRPPTGTEVAGGPLARLAMSRDPLPKKGKP